MTETIKNILSALSIKDIKSLIRKHNTHYFIRVKQSKADLIEALAKLYVLHKVGNDTFLKLKDEYNIEVIQKKPLRQRKIKPAQVVPVQQQIPSPDIIPQITVPIEQPRVEEVEEVEEIPISKQQYIIAILKNILNKDKKIVLPTPKFFEEKNFTIDEITDFIKKLEYIYFELLIMNLFEPDLVVKNDTVEKLKKIKDVIKIYNEYKVELAKENGLITPYTNRKIEDNGAFSYENINDILEDEIDFYMERRVEVTKEIENIEKYYNKLKKKKKLSIEEEMGLKEFEKMGVSNTPLNVNWAKLSAPSEYNRLYNYQIYKLLNDYYTTKFNKLRRERTELRV